MSGRQVGGRYILERKIAGGGMGAIWAAFDPQLQRRVAIKLTTTQRLSTAGAQHHFEKEAKAIARFRHPNVVQIHDFGLDKDEPYIVMELLEGEDLETRLKRREKLPPAQPGLPGPGGGAHRRHHPPRSQAGEPVPDAD
jgi:serine/threonine protein kinase